MLGKITKTGWVAAALLLVTVIGIGFAAVGLTGNQTGPVAYDVPPDPGFPAKSVLAQNTDLRSARRLDLGGRFGPEDIAIGPDGRIYCGFHDGNFQSGGILRMEADGSNPAVFADTGAWVTGLHFDSTGHLLANVVGQGLVSIAPDGSLRPLAEAFEGRRFLIPNDIDTGPDGRIYFTVTSTEHTFTMRNALTIILGARRADGGLYVFDPAQPDPRKALRELIRGLHFANGVAVDPAGRYALVVETGRYRVLRHWLKGPRAGTTDVWLDNLPGIPNGIARRPSAAAPAGGPHRYWLGFTTRRNALLDFLHPHPVLKALLLKMPDALLPAAEPYGLVMLTEARESGAAPGEVIADDAPTGDAARILRVFHDPDGRRVREAASIEESRGVLYLGGDLTDAILAFPLPADLRGTQGR